MQQIGINEKAHALICEYVDGTLDEKKRGIIESIAKKNTAIQSLIHDSRIAKRILSQHQAEIQASLK